MLRSWQGSGSQLWEPNSFSSVLNYFNAFSMRCVRDEFECYFEGGCLSKFLFSNGFAFLKVWNIVPDIFSFVVKYVFYFCVQLFALLTLLPLNKLNGQTGVVNTPYI